MGRLPHKKENGTQAIQQPKARRNPASDVARMVTSIELVPRANRNASYAQEAGNLGERPNTGPSARMCPEYRKAMNDKQNV